LFDRLLDNVALMLAQQRIHGDLSAFNVLYWEGNIRLIDFPQAVVPTENSEAYALLERDVQRLCQYFERYRLQRDARAIARSFWERYVPAQEAALELFDDGGAGDEPT